MGVDIHRGTDIGVAQQLLHVLGSRPVGEQIARERMPLRYNKDKSENRCGATSFGFVFILFPLKST